MSLGQELKAIQGKAAPVVTELLTAARETLRRDGELVLYRSRVESGETHFLLVESVLASPSLVGLKRLEHEYSLKDELDADWAARPVALDRKQGRTALVLEDPGGVPLNGLLGQPLELTRALRIGIGIAAALRGLHDRDLIHMDLKPANILVEPDTGKGWLMGFGIASRLPRELQSMSTPEHVAGTFAYMSPEQTGRMNRSIDSRSDLYSYGVVLYEMVTGSLPFVASDALEWVHCHVARQPVPPDERAKDIPRSVSAIVMRLLAKTAEERYQTAASVEADLRRCLHDLESLGRISLFALGEHDVSDRLRIPEKLYGRDRQVKRLLEAFERVVATGRLELALVAGYSGVGKSSVVKELQKAIVQPRGFFIAGKFDEHKSDIPYGTLAQAFQMLIRQILGKSEEEVDRWRGVLLEAIAPNGHLIANLIPELELIIGKQPVVPELPPQETQHRFQAVFRRFLGVFTRKEHPLVIFLDDLQWLDGATLTLLENLVTQPDVQDLLIIGAYRDNEVGPAHPLIQTLNSIRQAGVIANEIVLRPLPLKDVNQFIADSLCCEAARVKSLAQLVYRKTAGNPFFVIQFLTALAEEHLVEFDARDSVWKWKLAEIKTRGFTDNVVDLMIGKLKQLPVATQEALKLLACLGTKAEIGTLAMANGGSEEEIHSAMWEGVRAGLVLKLTDSYNFLHDRVREAAYSLIPQESRPEVHLRIGRHLVARMTQAEIAEAIFNVANQLNVGAALISDQEERQHAARLNLLAGRKAKASTAYSSACLYLSAGMNLIGSACWDRANRYDLAFALWLERAECELLSGNFDEAERLICQLVPRGVSRVDKAAAYSLKVVLHLIKSEKAQGVETALECLHLFGIEMSAHPTPEEVQEEYEIVWRNLAGRSIESLVDMPLMTNSEIHAVMRVLAFLTGPALYTDINLYYLHFCKMVNLSLTYGTSDASTFGYVGFGVILCLPFQRYNDGYRFAKLACDLVEKYGFTAYKAKVYLSMEMVVLWTQPIDVGIDLIRTAFRAGAESGDLSYACFSCMHLITDLLIKGVHLDDVWRESEICLDFVRKGKYRDAAEAIVSQQQFLRNLRGQTANFSTFSNGDFDEQSFEAQLTEDRMTVMVGRYWILKVQARFLSADYDAGLAAAEKAKELHWSSEAFFQSLDYHYYTGLTIAAVYDTGSPEQQAKWLRALRTHLNQLGQWAENCPSTFFDKQALIAAELARIEGRDLDAMHSYEDAIRSARENVFVQNEGIASEVAARFYLKRGLDKVATVYLRDARSCYLRWGALGKVKQLDQRYPPLEVPEAQHATTTIGTPVQQLDLVTVIKASQAVSGEIVLEKLIETLMVTAVEHAGAERGLLVLSRKEGYRIEAEATTIRDKVAVRLRQRPASPVELPASILHYVIRTQQSVILDDALVPNPFSDDEYIRRKGSRSISCLPLVKQATLVGTLYLENNLIPRAFTPDRLAVLELLASQAAISLDHARLYAELAQENSDRRKAEDALRASEERWRKLFENSSAGIVLTAVDGHYLAANLAFQKMLGYTEEELQRLTAFDVTHEEDRAQAVARLAAAAGAGQRRMQRVEKRFVRKDGGVIWADLSTVFVPATGSTPAFFSAVIVDITERKLAEEALRESEQRLQDIIDNTTAIVFVKDLELRYLLVNRGYERLHHVRREKIRGKTDLDVHPRAFAEAVRANDRQVIEAGEPIQFEEAVPSAEGERLYVAAKFLLRDRSGKPYAVCGIATDITERKRAENEIRQLNASLERRVAERTSELVRSEQLLRDSEALLRESEQRFSRAFRASPAVITLSRMSDGKFVEVNDSFARWIGLDRDSILGHDSWELGMWLNLEARNKFWADLRRDGSLREVECQFRTRRGTVHSVLVSADIIEVNREQHMLGFFLDITERKRIESELLRTVAREKELGRLRSNFVSMVSHEFRTPLGIIQSSAEILEDYLDQLEPAERGDHLQSIRSNTRRMAQIMEEVLLIGSFDAGKMEFKPAALDLRTFARRLVEEVLSVTNRRCPIELSLSEMPAEIQVDERLLQHIFTNLLTNGAKYSDAGRVVRFEIGLTETEIVCAVRDQGIGIPEADREWLFTPFHRGHNVDDRPGTGLGLVIVKRCVDLHGGKIHLESKLGEGTSVTVRLPIQFNSVRRS
jgi:PAS domain S-box-containing protein